LIASSAEQVGIGVSLVNRTGKLLEQILGRVGEVSNGIGDISSSADRQATNLQQVSNTVVSLDRVTQENAAMVEQTTAAARSLAEEAARLEKNVSQFRITRTASVVQRPAVGVRRAA
jgi:methyl-accepting chemotaxis protein